MASHKKARKKTTAAVRRARTGGPATSAEAARLRAAISRATGAQATPAEAARLRAAISGTKKKKKAAKKKTKR